MVSKTTKLLVVASICAGSVSGASSSDTSQLLIANPAAAFCEAEGGRYKIVQEEAGDRGLCVLSSGEEVDAWDYYRQNAQTDPTDAD